MTGSPPSTRIAVIGCGFWARFQIAGWHELPGARVAALYNRTRPKAEALARAFDVPPASVYDDAAEMIRRERPDVVDVITDVDTHSHFVRLAAGHRVPVICQKPMAPTLAEAEAMVAACREAGVAFKATAGLHHAVRRGDEHGFLNLLAATTAPTGRIEAVLAEEDPAALELDGADRRLFTSFGSCSWREPIEDLEELGLLS
jgi:hypothetical protein